MVVLRIKDGSGVVSEHRLPMSWREVDRSLLCELLELRAMGKGEKWWLDAAFLLLPVAVQDLLCEADVMSFASFLLNEHPSLSPLLGSQVHTYE